MRKNVWFYVKDFFTKTPIYLLSLLLALTATSIFFYSLLSFIGIIYQLLGFDNVILTDKISPLTDEDLQDTTFVYLYLAFLLILSVSCLGVIKLSKWLMKKAGMGKEKNS